MALEVSGAPSLLVPAFSPSIHDYYVRCQEGTNALTVTMTASPGASSALLSPTVTPLQPTQTSTVQTPEGAAIVAVARAGTATTEYWLRCLPHDFATMAMSRAADAGAATPGYYLLGNQTISSAGAAYAMVLDGNGVPVWYVRQSQGAPLERSTGAFDVDNVVDGGVSFLEWPSTLSAYPFEIHSFEPDVTTHVAANGWALNPHELRALPGGNFLLFTDETETGIDLTGYAVRQPDGGSKPYGPDASILPCDLLEVEPSGDVAWKWLATEHLDPVIDNIERGLDPDPNGDEIPDPFHCNSIDVEPGTGNLLVSSRHLDSIFYIERSSGDLLWKMGGVNFTRDGATYVPVADAFHRQHDARLLPGWTKCGGQLSLFDDESYQGKPARAVVYDVTVDMTGHGTGGCGAPGATVAWQWVGQATSIEMGSFRIEPDGSRVIGWGVGAPGGLAFTELNADGQEVLHFSFTDGSTSFRVVKVPTGAFDLALLRAAVTPAAL